MKSNDESIIKTGDLKKLRKVNPLSDADSLSAGSTWRQQGIIRQAIPALLEKYGLGKTIWMHLCR
jgi:hypothetical protein